MERENKDKMIHKEELDKQIRELEQNQKQKQEHKPPMISEMEPVTRNAYGGGMYAPEEADLKGRTSGGPPAGEAQSADGPDEAGLQHQQSKKPPPPSSGDRDIDITGQSYIQ